SWLQQAGNISDAEMLTTFNCGLGLLLIVTEEDCDAAVQALTDEGETPVVVGEIVAKDTVAEPGQAVFA
ncbi:MAG: AIR synthase-related protein, partial [Pseudomonadota bacterium]|nr:AIR synthase-related protein [Pseudomonadota bacterium]